MKREITVKILERVTKSEVTFRTVKAGHKYEESKLGQIIGYAEFEEDWDIEKNNIESFVAALEATSRHYHINKSYLPKHKSLEEIKEGATIDSGDALAQKIREEMTVSQEIS
jgi:hypothetical protein